MNWYTESRQAVRRRFPNDWRLVLALLVATSPRATLKANVSLALKAYHQFKATGTVDRRGFVRVHHSQILLALKGEAFCGRKCLNFHKALLGDPDAVVIDRWMMRAMGQPKGSPTNQQYTLLENKIRALASTLGVTATEVQARIWLQTRKGARNESYATHLAQISMF